MSFSKLRRLCFVLLSAMLAACHFLSFSALALDAPAENALPLGYQAEIGNTSYFANGNVGNFVSTGGSTIGSWESFNVGSDATFNAFIDGAHLSRVRTEDPSQIFGRMNIQGGSFFLINPSGILFGPGAQVNSPALLASALNISNEDFLAGNTIFHAQESGSGVVSNQGLLTALDGGFIALLGKAVENKGRIVTPNGSAVLAAGEKVSLSLDSEGLISAVIDSPIEAPVYDLNGEQVRDVVANFGSIQANGGQVILSARAVEQIFDSVINHSGAIEAKGTEIRNGRVVLTGDRVGLFGGSSIDVSGESGGGEVLIGGDYLGQNPNVDNADAVYMSKDSKIKADATLSGNGGKVILWSKSATQVYGTILARGGSVAGNGGFVETSSANYLRVSGALVNASAANGLAGTWLLDPRNVVIDVAGPTTAPPGYPGGTFNFIPVSDDSVVDRDDIQTSLDGGSSVTITTGVTGAQAGNITVNGSITKTAGATSTLTLQAANDITVNQSISGSPGFSLNVSLANDSDVSGAGNTIIAAAIDTKGGSFSSTGFTFTNAAGAVTTGAGTVTLNHTSAITLGSFDSTAAVSVTSTGGSITDNTVDNTMDLKGSDLTISAATGIGVGGSIDVDFATIISATSATGGIQLNLMDHDGNNQNTTVTLADATTTGDITFTSTSGNGTKTFTTVDTNSGNIVINNINNGNIVLGTIASDTGGAGVNDITVTAATGNITVNNSVTSRDQVIFTSTLGSIEDNASDNTADIVANTATLTASTGIGANSSLDVDVVSLPSVSSTTGGIALNLLDPNNSGVTVTSADAITSGDINLTATSGTGVKTYTLVDTNNGNINISAASGNIILTNVNSDTGVVGAHDISVTASAGNVTVATVTSDDDVTITAANAILDDNNDGTRIAGDRVALSAATGIGTDAATATIDTQAATVYAENSGTGDIYIEELNGLTLENVTTEDGDVSVRTLNAGNLTFGTGDAPTVAAWGDFHEVTLDVINGNIVDGNGAGEDVEAHSVKFITAAGDVGTAQDPIEVRSDVTDVTSVTGNSHITQVMDEVEFADEDVIDEELTKSLFNDSSDLSDDGDSSDEEEDEDSGEAFTPQSVAQGSDAVDESGATPAETPVTADTFQACPS